MDIRREFETGGFSCLSCHLAASAQLGRVLVEQIKGDLAGWVSVEAAWMPYLSRTLCRPGSFFNQCLRFGPK
jgi:hypothetical protein